jgi:hypothetical protein
MCVGNNSVDGQLGFAGVPRPLDQRFVTFCVKQRTHAPSAFQVLSSAPSLSYVQKVSSAQAAIH